MFYLILAIFSSTLIFVTFKFFERYKINILQAIVVNYIVAAAGGLIYGGGEIPLKTIPQFDWFPFAITIGITFILVFMVFAYSTQKIGVSYTAVSSKMSVVIPVTIGFFLYDEHMNALKIAGIIAALFAFYLTFYSKEKSKFNPKALIFPILLFFGNGTNDSLMKFSKNSFPEANDIYFVSTIFLSSLVIGIVMLFFNIRKTKNKIEGKNIIAGCILGLLNFISTISFFNGVAYFESNVFFPIFNASIVSLSAIVGVLAFKEKLNKINYIGIILAIIAITVIALG